MAEVERKYALIKVEAGDYLLPSNDGKTMWRIRRYVDGPSAGLDWPRDLELWGVWKWRGDIAPGNVFDPDDSDMWAQGLKTRREAVELALASGDRDV